MATRQKAPSSNEMLMIMRLELKDSLQANGIDPDKATLQDCLAAMQSLKSRARAPSVARGTLSVAKSGQVQFSGMGIKMWDDYIPRVIEAVESGELQKFLDDNRKSIPSGEKVRAERQADRMEKQRANEKKEAPKSKKRASK